MANPGALVFYGLARCAARQAGGDRLMSLQTTLQESLEAVSDGVAVGYLDLATGSLLGIAARDERPQEFLNVMAAAVTELFEAPLFKALDKIWSADFTEKALEEQAFKEILLLGNEYTTVLKRCEINAGHAVIYVTTRQAPPGVLLMQVRSNLPAIEAAI